jgi:predicted nucleic acid-binding protein
MPYLDSNIFIYPVIYQTDAQSKAKKAKEILLSVEKGQLSAYTSTLTWDEVVWVVTKVMSRNDGIAQGRKLLGFPNLQFIDTDENVLVAAQRLIEKYKLNPRDSIHIASALDRRLKIVISDDEDFDLVKEIKRTPLE